jgi:signal transduction histidine kinase/tetratricopeptide (TPR) repeat protein
MTTDHQRSAEPAAAPAELPAPGHAPGGGLPVRSLAARLRGSVLTKTVWPLLVALAAGSLVTAAFAGRLGGHSAAGHLAPPELLALAAALAAAAVALSWIIRRAVTRPLSLLARTARQVAAGNLEAHFSQTSNDEIGQLASALEIMTLELRSQLDLIGSQADALRDSSKRLASVQDEERRRLSRDLHDGLQQQLVVLRMALGLAPERMRAEPERARELFAELGAELDRVIDRVREVSHNLYPAILRDAGLSSALRSQASRLPIATHVTSEPDPLPRLPREIESSAYFILSEAVANVLKHAEATDITVALALEGGQLVLSVADNGRGFPREAGTDEPAPPGGLTHMDDRVRSLGGRLFVTSGADGTAIRASLPLGGLGSGRADGAVEPLLTESVRSGTFVGREEEIERLRTSFEQAAAGHGRLVLLEGEAGIGKTRTANELATYAASRGAEVLVGRCYEGGGAPAYWPWIQVIRSYVRRHGPPQLAEEMGPGAGDIAQMDPELARRLAPVLASQRHRATEGAEPAAPDPRQERFRLFDSVGSFLRHAAANRPLLIVLDDLQSADTPSLLLLEFLAPELGSSRLLVVGTRRDDQLPAGHPLVTTLHGLEGGHLCETVTLPGLSEADVGRFIELASSTAPPESLVSAVFRRTEGNPLFVREVVRLLASEGRLKPDGGEPSGSVDIPASVRDAIGRRLEHLSRGCNEVLAVASAIGREFDLSVLQAAASMPTDRLEEALEEAVAARVLVGLPDAAQRGRTYRFNHALMRETIYGQLPQRRRQRLHQRIAQVMEGMHSGDPVARLAALAHHYEAAGRGRSRAKAMYYATWAGERAAAVLAFEEAAGHYERALEALGELGGKGSEAQRGDLLLALGETQWRAGDTPRARETFGQAAAIARRLRDPNRLAQAAVGYGEGLGAFEFAEGADDVLVHLLTEALDALEHWPVRSPGRLQRQAGAGSETPEQAAARLKVRVLSRLAVELYYTDQVERRAALGQQAVALGQRLGDPRTQLIALFGHFRSVLGPDALDERLASAGEIERLAESIGDREMAFRGRYFRLVTLLEKGDRAAVDAGLGAWIALSEELRQPLYRWQALSFRATLALLDGNFAEGESFMREALVTGRHGPGRSASIRFGAQLFLHHWGQGLLAELEPSAREVALSYPWLPGWRTGLAVIYAELDRQADARYHFEQLAAGDFADLPRDGNWLGSVALASVACAYLRDIRRAGTLFELLAPYEDRCIVVHAGGLCLGSAATFLGMLAATLGRVDEAQRLFEVGLRRNESLGARPMAVLSLIHHAAMLTSRNGPRDASAALDLLAQAASPCADLGMAHAGEQLRELGHRAEALVLASSTLRFPATASPGAPRLPDGAGEVSPAIAAGRTAPPPPAD